MKNITATQAYILRRIIFVRRMRGVPPTNRELSLWYLGKWSTRAIADILRALERKGVLKREKYKSRAMLPVPETALLEIGAELGWRCRHCSAHSFTPKKCGNPACSTNGDDYAKTHGLL